MLPWGLWQFEWPALLPRTMSGSMVLPQQALNWWLLLMVSPKVTWMPEVWAPAGGFVTIRGPCCHWGHAYLDGSAGCCHGPCLDLWPSISKSVTSSDVHNSCGHQGLCSGSRQPPEIMLVFWALLLLGPYWFGWPVLSPGPWLYPGLNCCQGSCQSLCSCCSWGLWWCPWPMLLQEIIGTMHVGLWELCWAALLLTDPGIVADPTAAWELASPFIGELALSLAMGLGELALPLTWGSSSSGPEWPAQLPPRPTSWALGWPTVSSTPCRTCWSTWRN